MKRSRQDDHGPPGRGGAKKTHSSRHLPERQQEKRHTHSGRWRERSPRRPARERSQSRRDDSFGPRQSGASRKARPGSADARALNRQLTSCSSVEAVLGAVERAWRRGLSLDAVNVSTALHRIGRFSKQRRQGEQYQLARDPTMLRSNSHCETSNVVLHGHQVRVVVV